MLVGFFLGIYVVLSYLVREWGDWKGKVRREYRRGGRKEERRDEKRKEKGKGEGEGREKYREVTLTRTHSLTCT